MMFALIILYLYVRYKVQLRVIDDTDSTNFMIFDKEVSFLLNKSCVEIFESHDKVIVAHLYM